CVPGMRWSRENSRQESAISQHVSRQYSRYCAVEESVRVDSLAARLMMLAVLLPDFYAADFFKYSSLHFTEQKCMAPNSIMQRLSHLSRNRIARCRERALLLSMS